MIDRATLEKIMELGVEEVYVRTVLGCNTIEGVCQNCYGMDLAKNELIQIGSPVGIVAAQSI